MLKKTKDFRLAEWKKILTEAIVNDINNFTLN